MFAPLALMLGATAGVILRTAVLPRWQGGMAAVTAALLLVTVAGAGSVPPVGMLLALIWIAIVSVTLVRRAGAAEPVSVAVAPSAELA